LRAKVSLVGAEKTSGGGWQSNLPDEIGLPLKQLIARPRVDPHWLRDPHDDL
jgi:hypothetical protein